MSDPGTICAVPGTQRTPPRRPGDGDSSRSAGDARRISTPTRKRTPLSSTPRHDTLVVLAHPHLAHSRVNAALAAAARTLPSVEVRDLTALYPDVRIDVAAEQAAITAADQIVLQYPTHWYSVPGLLKLWLDDVLVRGWAYGTGAPGALAGKTLRVVTSTGGKAEAYVHGGFHGWPYDEILVPLQATAKRLGMHWAEPLVVHGARDVTDAELTAFAERYTALLSPHESEVLTA